MPLDEATRAELRRQARDLVQRENAAERVPQRISALRYNLNRLEGRSGRPVEIREENEYELEHLMKYAPAFDVPTELSEGEAQPESGEPE